jgi:hypothetical protein
MVHKLWPLTLILALVACHGSGPNPHSSSSSVLPPDPATEASDLTADELIAKYAAARGGEQALKGVQSVRMAGNWAAGKNSPKPVTAIIAPERYLRRIEQGSDEVSIKAVDGRSTWEVTPKSGIRKPTPMLAQDASRFRHMADPQGPLVDYQKKGNKVEVEGKMPWQGSQVYKLKVIFPDGGVNHLYLDAKTFLPVRTVHTMYIAKSKKDVDLETVYQDYRDAAGVKWPFTEKAYAPEVDFTQTISWQSIEPNAPVDESAFKQP